MAEGFICRRGGGIRLPSSIVAGTMFLYAKLNYATVDAYSYTDFGTGYIFTANKAGVYRVHYNIHNAIGNAWYATSVYARLVKNGVAVGGSEVSVITNSNPTVAVIAVTANAGDVIKLQGKAANYDSGSNNYHNKAYTTYFGVSIDAPNLQTAINGLVTIS